MTDETQGESPVEDAPVLPSESEAADPSPATVETADPVAAETPTQPRDEEGKFLSPKAQQRIDHLTWEKNQREREAEYWRNIAQQNAVKPEPKVEQPAKLPSLEEFGYDETKYQAALLEYADKRAEAVVERRLTEAEQRRVEQTRMETFATRQRDFAKANPDFEQRVLQDPTLPITEAMRDVIVDSPAGPELAYYLANDRAAAERISRLPPHMAALEMGRIEGRLSALKEVKTRPAPVVSKAPPPPPRVEDAEVSIAGVKASEAASDKLSNDEWLRLRTKELKRKKA
jgi:hypothetical protein